LIVIAIAIVIVIALHKKNTHIKPIRRRKNEKKMKTHEGVIESGDQDELAIGGEFGEGDSRDLIVDEGLQWSKGFGVPNFARAVVAGGEDEGALAVVVDRSDGHRVAVDDLNAFAGLHIPNPNALVEGSGHDVA